MSQDNVGGRPTKMCPAIRAKIVDGIGRNLPYQMAAWYARIHESTLYDWLAKGAHDIMNGIDSEFSRFSEDIKEVETRKVCSHLEALEDQTERWQSRAWLLERRWRNHFSDKAAEIEFRERLEKLEQMKNGKE